MRTAPYKGLVIRGNTVVATGMSFLVKGFQLKSDSRTIAKQIGVPGFQSFSKLKRYMEGVGLHTRFLVW